MRPPIIDELMAEARAKCPGCRDDWRRRNGTHAKPTKNFPCQADDIRQRLSDIARAFREVADMRVELLAATLEKAYRESKGKPK